MKIHDTSYFEKLKIRSVNVNDLSVNKTLSYVLWMTEIDSAEEFSKRFDGDDLVEVMDNEADSDNFVSWIELNVLTVDEYENSKDFLQKYEFDVFASNLSKEETKKHLAKMNASDMFKISDGYSMIVDDHLTYVGSNVPLFEN